MLTSGKQMLRFDGTKNNISKTFRKKKWREEFVFFSECNSIPNVLYFMANSLKLLKLVNLSVLTKVNKIQNRHVVLAHVSCG